MNNQEKIGALIAYQNVMEKIAEIKTELERKGITEKGLSVLEGFIEDMTREVLAE